jgi:predicted anti-sigma-YlaC factor YlaD
VRLLKTPLPICDWAREQLSLELDRELPDFDRARLDAHLQRCEGCRRFHAEIGSLTGVLRDAPLEPVSFAIEMPRRRFVPVRALQAGAAAVGVMLVATLSSVGGLSGREAVAPAVQLGRHASDRGDELSRSNVPRARPERLGDRIAL